MPSKQKESHAIWNYIPQLLCLVIALVTTRCVLFIIICIPDLHKQAAFVRKRMQQGEGGASQVIFKYDQVRKKHAVFALVQESFKCISFLFIICINL
jgi:hypothetical protein